MTRQSKIRYVGEKEGHNISICFAQDIFIVNNLISNEEKHAILNDQMFGVPNNRNAIVIFSGNLPWLKVIQNYFNN